MDALQAISSRRSPARLTDPGPSRQTLDAAYAAALNAPDHGKLRPWKIIEIAGAARQAFGELMAASAKRRDPQLAEAELTREVQKAFRAPLIIVVATAAKLGHKIPVIEQVMSAACLTQNLILALHASGFGSFWRTGAVAYDSEVKRELGLEPTDEIVGFIYVGTVAAAAPEPRRAEIADHVKVWRQPAA
ncbi:MAG TPA: nitroreductase [Burkholderiaceae bacterium]|jgi:nitroreductase|nr:nitroreductase [Burkholderiaceae bacterium]